MNVCVILDDNYRRGYHIDELRSLVEADEFQVPLILIDETTNLENEVTIHSGIFAQIKEFFQRIRHRQFMVFVDLEQKFADTFFPSRTVTKERKKLEKRKNVFEEIDDLDKSEVAYFEPEQVGDYTYEIPDEILDRVVAETDVVVLLGFSKILRGDILTGPEYGTLSFHGADIRKYRGRPGGFFQFINEEERIGLTLQQLTEDLDGGKIVHCVHADISEVKSRKETRYDVERLYGSCLVEGLKQLKEPSFEPEKPEPLGRLTYTSDGHELYNVYRCLKLTIKRRYFS